MPVMQIRDAARALIRDRRGQILLMKIEDRSAYDPKRARAATLWVTPGGGLDAGETHAQALQRELFEELGIERAKIGNCVWHGSIELMWRGVPTTIRERFFLVDAPDGAVTLEHMTADERRVYRGHAWFDSEALRRCEDLVLPKDLPRLLEGLDEAGDHNPPQAIDLSTP